MTNFIIRNNDKFPMAKKKTSFYILFSLRRNSISAVQWSDLEEWDEPILLELLDNRNNFYRTFLFLIGGMGVLKTVKNLIHTVDWCYYFF